MEEKEISKGKEMAIQMKHEVNYKIKSLIGNIKSYREDITRVRRRANIHIHIAKGIGKALENIPEGLIKEYRLYHDSISIDCQSEAASSKVAHTLLLFSDIDRFRKEMVSHGDNGIEWNYYAEIILPKDEKSPRWYTEKFRIYISPSYPNPECQPVKHIQESKYTSWTCERINA